MKKLTVLAVLLLLQWVGVNSVAHRPLLLQRSGINRGPDLVSDGVQEIARWGFIMKPTSQTGLQMVLSSSSCDETYGFMPCTMSILGNLFLLAVYGYLMMFQAATFMSNGSEILLAVMGPGIIGSLFLPILGAFPDALLILGCLTFWCPCIAFGQIAEIADSGSFSCGVNGILYTLMCVFVGYPWCYSCFYRKKLRTKFNLPKKPCEDWLVHCFCETCALCQEYRELKNKGFDPALGWVGNLEKHNRSLAEGRSPTAPPMGQFMNK